MIELNRVEPESADYLTRWNDCRSLCFDDDDDRYIEQLLLTKKASMYHITGESVDLTMMARNEDNEFIIMIIKGKGLSRCGNELQQCIFKSGYNAIRYHTNKKGMTRLLRSIGFSIREWVMVCHG